MWANRVAIAIAVGMVVGCASLPAPEGPGDTLLIVDILRDTAAADDEERGGSIFGHLEATLEKIDDPSVRAILQLNAAKNYEAAQGLPPGDYRVAQVVFQYQDANRPQPMEVPPGTVRIESGMLTVAPWMAVYRIEGSSRSNRMYIAMVEQPPEYREQLLGELSDEDSFARWRLTAP